MKLTTFGSEKEEGDDLLKFYSLLSPHPDAFIGYTDEGHDGNFTSLTGEKLEIGLTFHDGEPNNSGGVEDCLELYNLNNIVKYNDKSCTIDKPFICEFENHVKGSCENVYSMNKMAKDIVQLQKKLSEANQNLKRKDSLFEVEKSKYEQRAKKLQIELSENAKLNMSCREKLSDVENSRHEELIRKLDMLLINQKQFSSYPCNDLKNSLNTLEKKDDSVSIDEKIISGCNDVITLH